MGSSNELVELLPNLSNIIAEAAEWTCGSDLGGVERRGRRSRPAQLRGATAEKLWVLCQPGLRKRGPCRQQALKFGDGL